MKWRTLQAQLERAEADGKTARVAEIEAALEMPDLPHEAEYLWRSYLRLRRRKSPTDMGAPKPIEWPDIDAFLRSSRIDLAPWEIEILERLDDLYLSPREATAPSARPMSEEMFDKLFG